MTDRNAPFDENQMPEEGSTPYSWANLHGVKYRDFSASRAQARDRARQMAQEGAEAGRHQAEIDENRPNAEQPNGEVSPENQRAREDEVIRARRGAQLTTRPAAQAQAALEARAAQNSAGQPPLPEKDGPSLGTASEPHFPAQSVDHGFLAAPRSRSSSSGLPSAQGLTAGPEDANGRLTTNAIQPPRDSWARPAWLAEERVDSQAAAPKAPEDTLQGSRDRLASRWFALQTLFGAAGATAEPAPAPSPVTVRAPVLAVFSLAGGVGKTSLVATLGRALSARGERVLLVDTAAFGLLPFFFGARDHRMGVLRTFSPPAAMGDAPVQMITLDAESLEQDNGGQEALTGEIAKYARGISRVIVDLATASGGLTRELLRMAPLVLVPVVPDMNSVVSVSSIDAFFERAATISGPSALPYYVLNQFDPSLPLHLDVREVLLEQLGDRLLPFALRRTPAVSEALAEGMTVIDYAPNSTVAEDFASLAAWLKSVAAPATSSYRGVRWTER